jgi:hypothetical protein
MQQCGMSANARLAVHEQRGRNGCPTGQQVFHGYARRSRWRGLSSRTETGIKQQLFQKEKLSCGGGVTSSRRRTGSPP